VTFDLILVGFGHVGRRFVRLLDELAPTLQRRHDIQTRVTGIATRTRGQAFDLKGLDAVALAGAIEAGGHLTRGRARHRLSARGATMSFIRETMRRSVRVLHQRRLVLVETTTLDIERGQPAIAHVRAALSGGAHVITSNKGPAAFAYHALAAAACRADRCFLFESAVLDGIPLFALARTALPGVALTGFRGVVNSTTNYILAKMEEGQSFDRALSEMQRAGIAEADASLDVDGWDAAAKTAALANALLGARLTPRTIEREGVSAAAAERLKAARAAGRRLKLVASASAEPRSGRASRNDTSRSIAAVRGRVQLVELPAADLLAQLDGAENAIVLQTDLLGDIAVVQRGSGLTHTAYGLVSDLVTIARALRPSTQTLRVSARELRSSAPGAQRTGATPERPRRGPRGRTPSTHDRR
jgi:homoserine dehydrogenase